MIIAVLVLAILIAVLLYLIMPSFEKHKQLELLKGKFISHRGLHNIDEGIPENSLAAFRLSAEKGYPIENDIRLTKDGEVVVFHDATLNRACGVDVNVYDLTLDELKQYRLFLTDEKIPTLKECLDVVDGRVELLIEFKDGPYSSELLFSKANEILKGYKGKYFMQSFDPKLVAEYRKNRPDVCRGQLSTAYYDRELPLKLLGCLFVNCISRPHFVSYEHKHKNNIFFKMSKFFGAFPICWTIKNQQELDLARTHFKTFIFEGFIPKEDK